MELFKLSIAICLILPLRRMILFDQVESKRLIHIQWDLTALRLNNTKWGKYIEAMEKYENTKDLQKFQEPGNNFNVFR